MKQELDAMETQGDIKGTTAYSLVCWHGGCEEERRCENLHQSEATQSMRT